MRIGGGDEKMWREEWRSCRSGGKEKLRVGRKKEIKNRVVEGMKVLVCLREVWKKGKISKEIKRRMFECMFAFCNVWV